MSTHPTSIESIRQRIAEAVASDESGEQQRRNLTELLALAWTATRTAVPAEA